MNTDTNPQIERSSYGTLVYLYLNGVRIGIITPAAPLALYERSLNLQIQYVPIAPAGVAPLIYLKTDLTMGNLAKAAGLKSFDCALPYQWVKSEYLDRGYEWPIGVWSYDDKRVCGEFISRDMLLSKIGQSIAAIVGWDGLLELDHGWHFDPTWAEPQPGSRVTLRQNAIDHPGQIIVISTINPHYIMGMIADDPSMAQSVFIHLGYGVFCFSGDVRENMVDRSTEGQPIAIPQYDRDASIHQTRQDNWN